MRINVKRFLFYALAFAAITAPAAFKTTDIVYENNFTAREMDATQLNQIHRVQIPNGGEKKDGALWIKDPKGKYNNAYDIKLPAQMFADGGYYAVEAVYRGHNLKDGEREYFHAALSLSYKTNTGGDKTFWRGSDLQKGTTNWLQYYCLVKFEPKDVKEIAIHINNHMGSGDYYVDCVKISKAVEIPDSEVVAPANEEAKKIRRGRDISTPGSIKTYQGPITQYRGVQVCPGSITPADINDLGKWKANLIRFCFNDLPENINGQEYLKFIDNWIVRLDSLMPALQKNGIKVAICIADIPGAEKTTYASLNLSNSSDFAALEKAWVKIAEHYKGNPNVYGYDLLNEPYNIDVTNWHKIAGQLIAAIRKADTETAIITSYPDSLHNQKNIIYSPHYYSPHTLTHQGVGEKGVPWSYPGYINGKYWDKEQLRVELQPIIDFQKKHNAKIYIGEFSCVAWAKGADQYVKDCIELFEEYGWDWTYHAFREWPPWSIEMKRTGDFEIEEAKKDTPRKKTMLQYFKQNHK